MDSLGSQWVQASGGGAGFISPSPASGSNTRIIWNDQPPSVGPRQYADYYTFRTYGPNKSTVRFSFVTTGSGATTGEKWAGFVASDFSSAVALYCSGAGRWNFVCKNAGGSTSSPLLLEDEPYTVAKTYEIWWKANASGAQLWVNDRGPRNTITTQIPSGANLPIFFGNK